MAVVVDFDERDRCARARALQQCMERPAITGLGRFAGEHATVVAKNRPEGARRERVRIVEDTVTPAGDRKSVVRGKSGSVRVDTGGRRVIKTKSTDHVYHMLPRH